MKWLSAGRDKEVTAMVVLIKSVFMLPSPVVCLCLAWFEHGAKLLSDRRDYFIPLIWNKHRLVITCNILKDSTVHTNFSFIISIFFREHINLIVEKIYQQIIRWDIQHFDMTQPSDLMSWIFLLAAYFPNISSDTQENIHSTSTFLNSPKRSQINVI